MEPIDDDLYAELERHYPTAQIMELCFTVGLSNIVNRFHATFRTDLDDDTAAEFRIGSPLRCRRSQAELWARPPDRSEADDGRRVGPWNVSRV